ncbi:hypothetical protein Hdeb2414_s0006g00224381 [Helianthus debilis subsp. tardiflorus]
MHSSVSLSQIAANILCFWDSWVPLKVGVIASRNIHFNSIRCPFGDYDILDIYSADQRPKTRRKVGRAINLITI